jgi:hypothetical protein
MLHGIGKKWESDQERKAQKNRDALSTRGGSCMQVRHADCLTAACGNCYGMHRPVK